MPCSAMRVVQLDLLADHRLALDHPLGAMRARAMPGRSHWPRRRRGPVHLDAVLVERCSSSSSRSGRLDRLYWRICFAHAAQRLEGGRVAEVRGALGLQEVHRAAEAARAGAGRPPPLRVGLEAARVDEVQRRRRAGGRGCGAGLMTHSLVGVQVVHEHDHQLLRAMGAIGQGLLDVGGLRRPGDEQQVGRQVRRRCQACRAAGSLAYRQLAVSTAT